MPIKDLPAIKQFTFPQFEVITPHTGHSFLVRSMTVSQESVLKESAVSPTKALSIVNQTIFECIENKEAPFNSLDGFEKNLSMVDRVALMYGLIIATYGETQKMNLTCPACDKSFEINANLTANTEVKLYQGKENFIDKTVQIELPASKYKVVLKVPTLYDEKTFSLAKGVSKELMNKIDDYLIIKQLIVPAIETLDNGEKVEKEMVINNILEIYTTICKLPARDRRFIYESWNDIFGGYGVNVSIPTICPDCGRETKIQLNVVEELFRQLARS